MSLQKITNMYEKLYNWKPIKYFVMASLAYRSLGLIKNVLSSLYRLYKTRSYTGILQYKYKVGTWAVITGASSGIGRAFASELALAGFNIVVISNLEKENKETAQYLESEYKIKTRVLTLDFLKCMDDEEFFKRIFDELKDLEISILINNAGISIKNNLLQNCSYQDTKSIFAVNMFAPTMMIITLHPLLKKQRSMIINIASVLSETFIPGLLLYSNSKLYIKGLSRQFTFEQSVKKTISLQNLRVQEQEKSQIDVFCLKPSGVSTNMIKIPVGGFIISAETCARSALQIFSLGIPEAYGNWRHELQIRTEFLKLKQYI